MHFEWGAIPAFLYIFDSSITQNCGKILGRKKISEKKLQIFNLLSLPPLPPPASHLLTSNVRSTNSNVGSLIPGHGTMYIIRYSYSYRHGVNNLFEAVSQESSSIYHHGKHKFIWGLSFIKCILGNIHILMNW